MESAVVKEREAVFSREQRFYNDTTTWLAEVLPGNMRTEFEYRFDGHELYAQDGGKLGPIFKTAIEDAEVLADKNPNLLFELRRRVIELEEYDDMLKMAEGRLPNTMIVVSDFPAELMDANEDVGGYNTNRKQAMLRVISLGSSGSIKICSQSLDRSDRQALEAIYESLGYSAEAGELLGQRMFMKVSDYEQEFMPDLLTRAYDKSLSDRLGGEWSAGRQKTNEANVYDFVLRQTDLLAAYTGERFMKPDEGQAMLYGLAAAMEERLKRSTSEIPNIHQYMPAVTATKEAVYAAAREIFEAGSGAALEGKTYSGCGLSIGAGGTATELGESGYGNKSSEETKYSFDKLMHCVVCQAPPKDNEGKKMCGPCGICKGCDAKLKK